MQYLPAADLIFTALTSSSNDINIKNKDSHITITQTYYNLDFITFKDKTMILYK